MFGMKGDDLIFDDVQGPWSGVDFDNVSVTSVTFRGVLQAYAFLTHMNIDFDGAPNAYGPPEKEPLDRLEHAGWKTGYYGVVAVHPEAKEQIIKDGKKVMVLVTEKYGLKLDERFPDPAGKCPVVQQKGEYSGYYISTTSTSTRSVYGAAKYDPTTYIDSAKVPYGALSLRLQQHNVNMGDCGMVIRHDNGKQSKFHFADAGHQSGPNVGAVGECSYKVFRNVGGQAKTWRQKYANNNFPTSFLVFPSSKVSQLPLLAEANNADDLAMLLAFYEEEGYADHSGKSGKPRLDLWVGLGRQGPRPKHYTNIRSALVAAGFSVPIRDLPTKAQLDRIARTA